MIVRMCGRCQEEINKERERADRLEKELEELRRSVVRQVQFPREEKCFYVGDLTICPYCNNTKTHGDFLPTSNQ